VSPADSKSSTSGPARVIGNRRPWSSSSAGGSSAIAVPEAAHQLHLARVVPDVRRDRPAGERALHLRQGARPIRQEEVEHEPGDDDVVLAVLTGSVCASPAGS
jgi:hypothetical protein